MTTNTTHKPVLTARESTKLFLLEEIVRSPGRTKMAVITRNGEWKIANKTRAGQYAMIANLIKRGLVNGGYVNGAYSLVATAAGEAEIAHWAK